MPRGAFEPENVIYGFVADEILRGAAELRRFGPERGSSRSCLRHRAGAGRATASAPSFWTGPFSPRATAASSNCTSPAFRRTSACSSSQQIRCRAAARLRLRHRRGRGALSDPDLADARDDRRRLLVMTVAARAGRSTSTSVPSLDRRVPQAKHQRADRGPAGAGRSCGDRWRGPSGSPRETATTNVRRRVAGGRERLQT